MDVFVCPTRTSVSTRYFGQFDIIYFILSHVPMCSISVGSTDGITAVKLIYDAYEGVVHWKCNSFFFGSFW